MPALYVIPVVVAAALLSSLSAWSPMASPAPVAAASAAAVTQTGSASARRLTCSDFPPGITRDEFVRRFGAAAVEDGLLPIGEGMSEPGSTVFTGTPDHLDVFWNARDAGRELRSIVVRGAGSTWKWTGGIGIGTDLRAIEAANGGPFRLMGFAWDYQGTTMSWSKGKLEGTDTGRCRVRLRLKPAADAQSSSAYRQVTGAREYSSAHPAMQELNPRVYEMWLEVGRFEGDGPE